MKLLSKVFGPSAKEISAAWNEPKPLPIGVAEFDSWSERIISASMVSADTESLKYALANMIMQLGPHDDHKPDFHFIKQLRAACTKQVADTIRREIFERRKPAPVVEEKPAEDSH